VAAVLLARARRPQAADLITAAGLSAIVAGAIGLLGLSGGAAGLSGLVSDSAPKPTQGWNIYLLIVSLALIVYAARSVTRGPGYVGGLGFATFIILVGTNVVARLKGDDVGAIVGWPLLLLLIGAALLVAGFVAPSRARRTGSPDQPPPPPGAAPTGPGGGGLLEQWSNDPPPGQQPPQQ